MARPSDPTEAVRNEVAAFPGVAKGTSCNRNSFKAGKGSFLFVGPGPKGHGFKAMFKLKGSMPRALELAEKEAERFRAESGDACPVSSALRDQQGMRPRNSDLTPATSYAEAVTGTILARDKSRM